MESINQWFLRYLEEERAAGENAAAHVPEKERLFDEYLLSRIGELDEAELTDDSISELWDDLEAEISDRTELFSVLALVHGLLSFIARNSELEMPDLILGSSFVSGEGLPEISAFILNDYLMRGNSRHAMCFWLALHTDMPVRSILRLKEKDLALSGDTLTVSYDRRTRIRKEGAPKKKYIGTLKILLSDTEAAWWQANIDTLTAAENNLVSGTAAPENRRKLNASLAAFARRSGIDTVSLDKLEKTEWDRSETEPEDRYFAFTDTSDIGDGRIPKDAGDIFAVPQGIDAGEDQTAFSPEKLDEMMSVFPTPVIEHCRRTRQIAAFILEHIRGENWFLDTDNAWRGLPDAIYYHDLGKAALTLDDYYSDGQIGSEQDERYRSHVRDGLNLFRSESTVPPEEYAADSFGGMLRDAILDHHERYDGKGFPNGKKGDEISVAGRLCAIADTLDHKLFVSSNIDTDTEEVLDEIVKRAGSRFDARLVRVLTEYRDVFLSFVEEMRAHYRGKRTFDAYGMRFVFSPFKDTVSGETAACDAHLYLNDPYYGLLDSEIILPVVEDHPRYQAFTRLELKRLCRLICEANEKGNAIPPLYVKIAAREMERESFFTNLFRMFVNCGVRFRQLTVLIDEEEAIGSGADLSGLADRFHMIGANFGLCRFGGEVTLLPSLGRIRPDVILLKPEYADCGSDPVAAEMLGNILNIAKKMDIPVFCPGIATEEQYRYLKDAGVAAVGGLYVAAECSEAELVRAEND